MPLGASSTAGIIGSDDGMGYRSKLLALLKSDSSYDPNVTFVGPKKDVSGGYDAIGGSTILDMLNGGNFMPPLTKVLDTYQPDVILLHAGSNDMEPSGDDQDGQQTADRLTSLLDLIRTQLPNTYVIVTTTQPQNDPVIESRIETFNDLLVNSVVPSEAAQGMHIYAIDLHANVVVPDDYHDWKGDGIHLNDGGYTKFANLWNDKLQELLPELLTSR